MPVRRLHSLENQGLAIPDCGSARAGCVQHGETFVAAGACSFAGGTTI
jgi:hypothetical protein